MRSFPVVVLATFLVINLLSLYPLATWGSFDIAVAVVTGGFLGLGNVLLGYVTIEFAFDKSYTTFLKAVLGGMGARMLLLLGVLLALVTVFHVHPLALTVSLVLYYSVFLVLEILYIQRRMLAKGRQ